MWTINARNVIGLRTPGGDRFTEFVDALVRAYACGVNSVPMAQISTNLRTNIPDGGVDTEVREAIVGDPTGWFDVPTCWQYKATQATGIKPDDLREEIGKPYARQLIEAGYGYRLCVCDDITPQKRRAWERLL